MTKYAVLDCETTFDKLTGASPFTKTNKLCLVGIKTNDKYHQFKIEYDDDPYGESLRTIASLLSEVELVIGHNLKFDMHWIRRYVPAISWPRVWDTQLAEFILHDQRDIMPSLDDTAGNRGLGHKLDVVFTEYWSKGINTPSVPLDLLGEYLEQDCRLTEKVYLQQNAELQGAKRMLYLLQCEDLKILHEMEWNGMLYDFKVADEKAKEAQVRLVELTEDLFRLVGSRDFNPDSSDQLSVVLYGGTIPVKVRESYQRTLKDGMIVDRERWGYQHRVFPRIVKPLPRTECKPTDRLDEDALRKLNEDRQQQGLLPYVRHWSVGEPVIKRLRGSKRAAAIIKVLLERAYLDKLDSVYYTGLRELRDERGWADNILHGQLNQTVAKTGRLSSSGPNLQNFSGDVKGLFLSRYA
jgi:DNA polymerase I-like protein with 3'-5' exonuclease and polymerase domains